MWYFTCLYHKAVIGECVVFQHDRFYNWRARCRITHREPCASLHSILIKAPQSRRQWGRRARVPAKQTPRLKSIVQQMLSPRWRHVKRFLSCWVCIIRSIALGWKNETVPCLRLILVQKVVIKTKWGDDRVRGHEWQLNESWMERTRQQSVLIQLRKWNNGLFLVTSGTVVLCQALNTQRWK